MGRDSILNDAERKKDDEPEPTNDDGGDDERVKLTQRMPEDLVRQVDRVQEEYALPSRNAAINFIVKQGIREL